MRRGPVVYDQPTGDLLSLIVWIAVQPQGDYGCCRFSYVSHLEAFPIPGVDTIKIGVDRD